MGGGAHTASLKVVTRFTNVCNSALKACIDPTSPAAIRVSAGLMRLAQVSTDGPSTSGVPAGGAGGMALVKLGVAIQNKGYGI